MGIVVDLTTEIVGTSKTIHGEATSVATSTNPVVATYTVPVGKTAKLQRIEFSGNNIATYTFELNGSPEGRRHTWFNGPMFGEFEFSGLNQRGIILVAGDVVQLKVIHERPDVGDFDGRIQVLEID